ncbi:MAG TPA: DUF481 domain-containing protein [Candidatus Limnocylindria bacterium]|nr:DUF481 domain-containing protein [Candidatus Limnocylindria bacterium]
MTRRSRSSWVLAVSAWLAACSAIAQTVSLDLKTGERITGQIISETTNRVVLSNAWARELVIPLAEVLKRTIVPLTVTSAFTNLSLIKTNVLVAATNAPAKTNGLALAKAIAATNTFFAATVLKNWHGEILLGTDLTFSERNRQVYNAKAKLTYAKNRFKTVIDYDATYGRSQVEELDTSTAAPNDKRFVYQTDSDRMNGAVKTDFDLTKKWYVYNIAGMGYDTIRKIDLRYEIGPGAGYHLIQRTNFFLNTEAGANYQHEDRTDSDTLSTFFFRLAENVTWKITPRLSWDEKFEYMPQVENLGKFRARFETNLRYALLQNVLVNLSVVDLYDSDPADGVTKNDLQIRSSVGVKF